MPDLTPPAEAAHDSYVLLLWIVGILLAALVAQEFDKRLHRKTMEQQHRDDRKADATVRKEQWKEVTEWRLEQAKLSERAVAGFEKLADIIERRAP